MDEAGERARTTLALAERIQGLLKDHGLDSALIGAMACACYGYSRATEDVDLAVYADPVQKLPAVVRALVALGYEAQFERPDSDDPLGGVITIRGDTFEPIQIVNFLNPLSGADNPGWEAIHEAREVQEGRSLRVVSLPHLIALKLYAGGAKSRLDVIELLERNIPIDVAALRTVCSRFGVAESLDSLLSELSIS